jgi:ABC-type Fe3+-hydroxamate transport system substrate-binding protein
MSLNKYEVKKLKKFILIIVFCLLFTFTSCNNDQVSNTTNNETESNNDYIYVNNLLGYSVNFPNMKDRLVVTENDNDSTYIYSKIINDYLQDNVFIIATIYPLSKSDYPTKEDLDNYLTNDTPVPTFYCGETNDNFICFTTASDAIYPTNDEVENEFEKIMSILKDNSNFKVLDN